MKSLSKFLIFGTLLFSVGTVGAEVMIKQVPMKSNDVAGLNGHEMYNELCAVCHGENGHGDGPASLALERPAPDLTQLSVLGERGYTHAQLESVIAGRDRTVHQGIVGMPLWESEFQYVRTWNGRPRATYARTKIHSLAEYVESMALAASD